MKQSSRHWGEQLCDNRGKNYGWLVLVIAVAAIAIFIVVMKPNRTTDSEFLANGTLYSDTAEVGTAYTIESEELISATIDVNAVYDSYVGKLETTTQKWNDENGECEYFLLDITNDDIPELFVFGGTCEDDYELKIYEYCNDNLIFLKKIDADHCSFYRGNQCLIKYMTCQGEYCKTKYSYTNDEVIENVIFKGETDDKYPSVSEPMINMISSSDYSPIRRALGI